MISDGKAIDACRAAALDMRSGNAQAPAAAGGTGNGGGYVSRGDTPAVRAVISRDCDGSMLYRLSSISNNLPTNGTSGSGSGLHALLL